MLLDLRPAPTAAARDRDARRVAEAPAADLRRVPQGAEAGDGVPAELAFLLAQGVAPALLQRAARAAAQVGVTGEAALFGLGFPDARYYRLLARHLGARHLDRPLPLARHVDIRASAAGSAALAPNPGNLANVMAPRGEALRMLLRDHRFSDRSRYDFAVTTPRRFEAMLRRHDRAEVSARAASGLSEWDPALSARGGATARQRSAALALLVILAFGFGAAPGAAWIAVSLVLLLVFSGAVAQRLVVTAAGAAPGMHGAPERRLSDAALPIYTLIVPLFREARVVEQLVRNLDALDYPPAKLDIKIMLEEGDRATTEAVARLRLPVRYDVMVMPPGHPRTKPRALNAALEAARGELVVVYDAEDRPEAGQLRLAAARFAAASGNLACLQARLTIDHADESWVARMFAFDYAALFHVVKPGLAALDLPIPLGGTSNHFRVSALNRVNGWDAWNVTEDIDLGFRLARFGLAVGSLDSDTFEEAPLTLSRWMPQRSRWLKGWMVTLMVHSREPRRFVRELGWRRALSAAAALAGTVLSCLVGPPLLMLVAVEGCRGTLFRPETPLWWIAVAAGAALFAAGVATTVWPVVAGLKRMGRLDLAGWIATLPIYLLLLSAAAWRALFELWRDPQAWNKTEHGLARHRYAGAPRPRPGPHP